MKAEERLQISLSRYIDYKYPQVIYTSDASGLRLPIGLAVKSKAQRCKKYKIPDMIILHPSNGYHGLAMELKKGLSDVFCKNGELRQGEHIQAQQKTILRLQEMGYKALFVCGIDHAMRVIDEYFKS